MFHWGLIPVWAKERKLGQKMINARAETMASKPAFKGVFKKHRCIIPMDGFYEWQAGRPGGPVTKAGKPAKQPMFIHRLDGEPLAVAGLWSAWRDPADRGADWLHTASVVTTSANGTMAPIHDRMPVILPAVGMGDVARPRQRGHRVAVRAARAGPRHPADDPRRQHRRQQRPQQGRPLIDPSTRDPTLEVNGPAS